MTKNRASVWKDYQPALFAWFDPTASFLTSAPPRFRDVNGKELLCVDESIELLLLGYGALRQIGGKRLPSPAEWERLASCTKEAIRSTAASVDFSKAALRGDERIEFVQPFTYSVGSPAIAFLAEESTQRELANGHGFSQAAVSGLLSLMWLDHGLNLLRHEPLQAIDFALRARQILGESLLQESRAELKRELAVAGAKSKLAKDPKQRSMQRAKLLWQQNRGRFASKAALARFILQEVSDLESDANLVRRFGEWEEKAEDS